MVGLPSTKLGKGICCILLGSILLERICCLLLAKISCILHTSYHSELHFELGALSIIKAMANMK